jgi:(1->4)-alpha-D-glucan 1-alpha-D-glucosylmutase
VGTVPPDRLRAALADPDDPGMPKLRVVREVLHVRRRLPDVFGPGPEGAYTPLAFAGGSAGHAVGFVRGPTGTAGPEGLEAIGPAVAVVVPRLVLGLAGGGGWADTVVALPPGRWTDLITGAVWDVPAAAPGATGGARPSLRVADLLGEFPVTLLERSP